jgi:hypothetical protein
MNVACLVRGGNIMIGADCEFVLNLLHRLAKIWKRCLQWCILAYDNIHLQIMERAVRELELEQISPMAKLSIYFIYGSVCRPLWFKNHSYPLNCVFNDSNPGDFIFDETLIQ